MNDKHRRNTAKLGFAEGKVFSYLAKTYPNLEAVILELVQNPLDAGATMVQVIVNLKSRLAICRDNGSGVTRDFFENQVMPSIGQSQKSQSTNPLGEFGLGLISPLEKCRVWEFTSCPTPGMNDYRTWYFHSDRIGGGNLNVPSQYRHDFLFDPKGRTAKSKAWRSEMFLRDIIHDYARTMVSARELASKIRQRYGQKMLENGATVSIEVTNPDGIRQEILTVTGEDFLGTPLKPYEATDKDAGKTNFRMFIARRTEKGRNGTVYVRTEGKAYRLPLATVVAKVGHKQLDDAIVDALRAGIFEGEIVSEKARFEAGRGGMEKGDALVGLLVTITDWWENVGAEAYQKYRTEMADSRLKNLAIGSLKVLEKIVLGNPILSGLFKCIKEGTIGIGHTLAPGRVIGEDDAPSVAITGGAGKPKTGNSHGGNGGGEHEQKGHHPFKVYPPNREGTIRLRVKAHSVGISLAYEEMPGESVLWRFDLDRGIVTLNMRHPAWIDCEKHDHAVQQLQEYVAVHAMILETLPEAARAAARLQIEQGIRAFAQMFMHADRLAGRQVVGKKRGKKADKSTTPQATVKEEKVTADAIDG